MCYANTWLSRLDSNLLCVLLTNSLLCYKINISEHHALAYFDMMHYYNVLWHNMWLVELKFLPCRRVTCVQGGSSSSSSSSSGSGSGSSSSNNTLDYWPRKSVNVSSHFDRFFHSYMSTSYRKQVPLYIEISSCRHTSENFRSIVAEQHMPVDKTHR